MKLIYLFITVILLNTSINAQTKYYKLTKEKTTNVSKKYSSLPVVYNVLSKEINVPTKKETSNKEYTELEIKISSLKKDSINEMIGLQPKIELFDKKNECANQIKLYLNSTEKNKIKKEYLIKAQKIIDDYNLTNNYNLKYKVYPNKELHTPIHDVHNQLIYKNWMPSISRNLTTKLKTERNKLNNTPKKINILTKNDNVKKQVLLLSKEVNDITTISGVFKSLGNIGYDYIILNRDIEGFSKNEILDIKTFKEKKIKHNFKKDLGNKNLIVNKETNEYFLVDGILLSTFAQNMTLVKFEEKLKKLGYKTEDKGDDIIIYANDSKLVLTNDIYTKINEGNTNYINEIIKSQKQFKTHINTSLPLTKKLVNHYSSYKNKTMTKARLITWKSDLEKAKSINKKIKSLKGNERENITNFNQQIEKETLDKYNDFWQVIKGSEQVIGI